jgi:hypothetical protein
MRSIVPLSVSMALLGITVPIVVGSSAAVENSELLVAQGAVNKNAHDDSGIAGLVVIRPIRPHATKGVENSQPYQATIEILDSTGRLVTTFQTGADGTFHIRLEPGEYLLRPQSGRPYPRASEQMVTVEPKTFKQVRITYDTGMR